MLALAIVLISLALAFYTLGVWAERRSGELRWWHVAAFAAGLAADISGTAVMSVIAGSGGPSGLGLAFDNDQLVFTIDLDDAQGQRVQAFFRVDFDSALNPTAARLESAQVITTSGQGGVMFDVPLGLTTINSGVAAGPIGPLFNPGNSGIDRRTIDPMFASVSYSQRALDSGAVEALFLDAFLRSAQDPMGCVDSSLMAMVLPALRSHVEETSGIGRTSHELRSMITSDHPCFSIAGPPSGTPSQ